MVSSSRDAKPAGDTAARAQNLISSAYQLPTAARTTWLREQCRDDDALRREVSWMLEALRAPDDEFLEGRPHVDAHEPIEGDLSVPAPRDYRILRPLGEGGMGTVYLAERVDGDYTQQVALKFLNAFALVNPAVVSRFVDERRILAQLNHPNIAHLVDGGSLSDGRPFIAMEYVPGVRLDHYADAMRLDLRQRLALFLKVCAGVQYAHQRLVIHRDLKPANILVGEDGEPKLLDFGIARLIDGPDSHQTRTEAGLRMMTLAYASPEQIRGDALGTATDVYSLGVILYELLTGSRPWRDDASAADLARQICDTEPPVPSTQARRTGNARSLDADLDAIVLKALRKAPGDRYGSVRELADDIRNYLDSRPVLARRGHRAYRLRKFVARHRFAVVASLALFALVVGFAWDRQVQLLHVERERGTSEQITTLMLDSFRVVDPVRSRGRAVAAREVLDDAWRRVDGVADVTVRLRLVAAIASAYYRIGEFDKAVSANERALAEYAAIGVSDGVEFADALARLGIAKARAGLADRGEVEVDAALAMFARLGIGRGNVLASTLGAKAQALDDGAADDAVVEAVLQRAVAAAGDDPDARAEARLRYAFWFLERDRPDDALREARGVLAQYEARNEPDHPNVLAARSRMARALQLREDFAGAIALCEANVAAAARLYGDRSIPYAEHALTLSSMLALAGEWARAEAPLRRAVEIYRGPLGGLDANGRIRAETNLESVLRELGKRDESRRLLDEILQFSRAQFGADHYYYGYAVWALGMERMASRDWDAALAAHEEAIGILARYGTRFAQERANLMMNEAVIHLSRGDGAAARARIADGKALYLTLDAHGPAGIARYDAIDALGAILQREPGARARFDALYRREVESAGACSAQASSLREWWDATRAAMPSLPALAAPPACAATPP